MEPLTAVPPWHAQYEALYREHLARVVRLCRSLLDPQESHEVAQEVFLKLLRAYRATDQRVEWGAWLTRVALNACRDRRRSGWWRWGRAGQQGVVDVQVIDRGPTPEGVALAGETRERIWQAFWRLPRRQREVFVLRHLDGCSTEDVAAALGVTTGSVKRHLFRAVQRLREALGGGS